MNRYLLKLEKEMENQGIDSDYIEICLNYASELMEKDMPVIFDYDHLSFLLQLEPYELSSFVFGNENNLYNEMIIPKKSGGVRVIDIPCMRLKRIQKWILNNILYNFKVDESCVGFIKNKSIYDNAIQHTNKRCVLNMDIKDYFPSISRKQVFQIFYSVGYAKNVSFYLSKLLTKNDTLPQGSPASPMLSNIVSRKLDNRLKKVSACFGATYTRYADDLTFSGDENIKELIPIVEEIVDDENFCINRNKTRYAYYYQRQEVTGLIVNKGVSVPRKYIKEIKKEIYYCKKYGVSSHLEKTNNNKSFYKEHMYGKAYFVRMINQSQGDTILNSLDEIEWDY